MAPFNHFTNTYRLGSSFKGTVIRCPLRWEPSALSSNVIKPETIHKLLGDFIAQELDLCLLFLKNVKNLEILDIGPTGVATVLAKVVVSKDAPSRGIAEHTQFYKEILHISKDTSPVRTQEWLIVHSDYPESEVTASFLQQPGNDSPTVLANLKKAKFLPEVSLALDLSLLPGSTNAQTGGRLFTFLPLPIATGFPIHIHALFAIDSSRRYLRRAEAGLLPGSKDQFVIVPLL